MGAINEELDNYKIQVANYDSDESDGKSSDDAH